MAGKHVFLGLSVLLCLLIGACSLGTDIDTIQERLSKNKTYTISFDSNGGSSVAGQTVKTGETATRPANPTRSGYTFDYWYSNSGLTTAYNFSTPVTRNITLYAKWNSVSATTYTVTFESNGGSYIATQTVNSGSTVNRPTDPIRNGFMLDNWYSDSGLTTVYSFSTPVTRNITLYAKWNVVIAPTYGVTLSETGTYTFPAATAGYAAQTARSVTVTNTGNQATGALTAALSGSNASSFTLSSTSINSIAASGTGTFTVVPNTGLAVDTYTATVTVSGSNGITAAFNVSFTVGDTVFNSIAAFRTWLSGQPDNTAATAYTVKLNVNDLGGNVETSGSLGYVLRANNSKYVSLDLSGSTITSIGDIAFAGCTSLTGIIIPNNVTSIGYNAFSGCTGLTGVTIPNSVTSIGQEAFVSCSGLTSITIPNNVTSIGPGVFIYCHSLTEINVAAGNSAFTSENGILYNKDKTKIHAYPGGKAGTTFNIPDSVTRIGDYAFTSCIGLTSVTFRSANIAINDSGGTFPGDLRAKYLAGGIGTYTTKIRGIMRCG